ncbi:MAG TPA: OsmC family protein [Candidatus Limnocylindrales bacterium]|nr:OsmC family protein [Candidatus Limnocylindrales bacterium]
MTELNGMDVVELTGFVASVASDPSKADRDPVVVARWTSGDGAEVTSVSDGLTIRVGGDGAPSAMRVVLMALAACDVDVVATRASLLGIEIESLRVEATGHFNVQRYLGLDAEEGPGYQSVAYTVHVRTRGGRPEQIAELRRACEEASPVGDTLQRRVALRMEFDGA